VAIRDSIIDKEIDLLMPVIEVSCTTKIGWITGDELY
jgi:hypothetical protein